MKVIKYTLFASLALFTAACASTDEPLTDVLIGKWTVKGLDYPEVDESKMQITFAADNLLTYHLKADTDMEINGFYQFNNDILFLSNEKAVVIFELPLVDYNKTKIEFENEVVFK